MSSKLLVVYTSTFAHTQRIHFRKHFNSVVNHSSYLIAKFSAVFRSRTVQASSQNSTSKHQCKLFSILPMTAYSLCKLFYICNTRNKIPPFTVFLTFPYYHTFNHAKCSDTLPLLFIFKPSYVGIKTIYLPFYSSLSPLA